MDRKPTKIASKVIRVFIIRPLALIALIQADPSSTHDLGLKVLAAQPAPELNALFEQRVG